MQIWPASVITSSGEYHRAVRYEEAGGEGWVANKSGVILARIFEVRRTHFPVDGVDNRWLVSGVNETGEPQQWVAAADIGGCGCGGSTLVAATVEQLAVFA